jgi:hypothetical protein
MEDLDKSDKTNISKFIEYILSLLLYGFDEMEMEKRLELVKLTAYVMNIYVEKTFGRVLHLEKRVKHLEEQLNKKNKISN